MPTLHVRNVPETLYDRIREQAEANQRSINAGVAFLLDRIASENWSTRS